jgi:hypothetical protein
MMCSNIEEKLCQAVGTTHESYKGKPRIALDVLDSQLQELKARITENIKLFGSAGKA